MTPAIISGSFAVSLFAASALGGATWNTLSGKRPLIYGHRGDAALMPPYTLASFSVAAAQGADFLEPGLVMTKDGVIVVRHDILLELGTNVAKKKEFSSRKKNMVVDGDVCEQDGHMITDFTWEEVKTLRATQERGKENVRDNSMDGLFKIVTFEQFLVHTKHLATIHNRTIGIIPELIRPAFYRKFNKKNRRPATFFEDEFLRILKKHGVNMKGKNEAMPVQVQCFDAETLRYLRKKANLHHVQLVTRTRSTEGLTGVFADWYFTPKGLKEVSRWANTLSPWKQVLLEDQESMWSPSLNQTSCLGYNFNKKKHHRNIKAMGGYIPIKNIVQEVHKHNMTFVTWTFRGPLEDKVVRERFNGSSHNEIEHFFDLGVDGIFVENEVAAMSVLYSREQLARRGKKCSTKY